MSAEYTYLAAFLVGFLGGVHCVGMCGGIVGALCAGLGQQQHSTGKALPFLLSYNFARILSYTLAGALMGGIGWLGTHLLDLHALQQGLQLVAALFMIALGLYISGWWRGLAKVEQLGGKLIWSRLQPLTSKLMPVQNLRQAFLLGLLWGWLPCGLVYSVIIWTITSQSPVEGALLMLSFGLGTLPNLLLMGVFASTLLQFVQHAWVKQLAGSLVILFGVVMLYRI